MFDYWASDNNGNVQDTSRSPSDESRTSRAPSTENPFSWLLRSKSNARHRPVKQKPNRAASDMPSPRLASQRRSASPGSARRSMTPFGKGFMKWISGSDLEMKGDLESGTAPPRTSSAESKYLASPSLSGEGDDSRPQGDLRTIVENEVKESFAVVPASRDPSRMRGGSKSPSPLAGRYRGPSTVDIGPDGDENVEVNPNILHVQPVEVASDREINSPRSLRSLQLQRRPSIRSSMSIERKAELMFLRLVGTMEGRACIIFALLQFFLLVWMLRLIPTMGGIPKKE